VALPNELQLANSRLVTEGLERRRAQEEAQRINRELQDQLADMRRLHEMLEEILDSTIGMQNANFGNIQLYDEKTGSLHLAAQRAAGACPGGRRRTGSAECNAHAAQGGGFSRHDSGLSGGGDTLLEN
jgi:hypothetical protein